jgi:hypothetical protein
VEVLNEIADALDAPAEQPLDRPTGRADTASQTVSGVR